MQSGETKAQLREGGGHPSMTAIVNQLIGMTIVAEESAEGSQRYGDALATLLAHAFNLSDEQVAESVMPYVQTIVRHGFATPVLVESAHLVHPSDFGPEEETDAK
jgi:hypothetical protein